MMPREVFVVGVRIVGLLQLAKALDYLIAAFDISTGLYKPYSIGIGSAYAHILVYLGIGIYLLSGAPQLVRLVFDRQNKKKTEQNTTSEEKREQV